jgi:hypothetical protein
VIEEDHWRAGRGADLTIGETDIADFLELIWGGFK